MVKFVYDSDDLAACRVLILSFLRCVKRHGIVPSQTGKKTQFPAPEIAGSPQADFVLVRTTAEKLCTHACRDPADKTSVAEGDRSEHVTRGFVLWATSGPSRQCYFNAAAAKCV